MMVKSDLIISFLRKNGKSQASVMEKSLVKTKKISKQPFYKHLKKLVVQDKIKRFQEEKLVFYSLPENVLTYDTIENNIKKIKATTSDDTQRIAIYDITMA